MKKPVLGQKKTPPPTWGSGARFPERIQGTVREDIFTAATSVFKDEVLQRFRDHRDRLLNRLAVILMKKPSSRFVEVPFPPGDRDFVVFDTELRIFTEARVKVLERPVKASELQLVKPEWFKTFVVPLPKELRGGKG